MAVFSYLALLCMALTPVMEAAGSCNYTLKEIDYDEIENGLDARIAAGSSVKKVKNILRDSGASVSLAADNTVLLVSLSDTTLNVKYVSLEATGAQGVNVSFLDQKENVISSESLVQQSDLFTADVDVSGVRRLLFSFDAQSTVVASELYFTICTDICIMTEEKDDGELTITQDNLASPELLLRGSGGLINGSGANQVEFLTTQTGNTVTISFLPGNQHTVVGFYAETLNCKSISLKMYDADGDRVFRDTQVVDGSGTVSTQYEPFSPPQMVQYMEVQFRHEKDDNGDKLDVGVQNIYVTVCA